MNYSKLLPFLLLCFIACQQPKEEKSKAIIKEDVIVALEEEPKEISIEMHEDTITKVDIAYHTPENEVTSLDDCVFNDDIKGISIEWAEEMGHSNAQWDSLRKCITTKFNDDSLFYSKGGCYHYTTSVTLKSKATYPLDSMNYWLPLTIQFTKETELKAYNTALKDSSFYISKNNPRRKVITIEVDNQIENIVYEGIILEKIDDYVEVKIVTYIN